MGFGMMAPAVPQETKAARIGREQGILGREDIQT
jgi:hypothetical protein